MFIRTEAEAEAWLKAVHGFHDGFVRRIVIDSQDSFQVFGPAVTDVALNLTGRLNMEVEFVHDPTMAELPPSQATTLCRFHDVAEVRLDLSRCQGAGWALYEVSIKSSDSGRLSLHCHWSNQTMPQRLFSFAEMEVPQGGTS